MLRWLSAFMAGGRIAEGPRLSPLSTGHSFAGCSAYRRFPAGRGLCGNPLLHTPRPGHPGAVKKRASSPASRFPGAGTGCRTGSRDVGRLAYAPSVGRVSLNSSKGERHHDLSAEQNYAAGKRNRTPSGRAVPGRKRPCRRKGCDRGADCPSNLQPRTLFP